MQLDTYLFFNGDCADTLALYQAAFGAEIHTLIRFRGTPDATNVAPEWQDKVMHALFSVGSNAIMVSDSRRKRAPASRCLLPRTMPHRASACSTCWPMAAKC